MPTLIDRPCEEHPSIQDWLHKPADKLRRTGYEIRHDSQRRTRQGYAKCLAKRRIMGTVWTLARDLASSDVVAARAHEAQVFENRFRELVGRWREETRSISSTSDRALHPAYQDIIGMGERALPLLFREMEQRGGHWFWALRHITHENPVPAEDAGKIQRMTEAWLRWGREHRYL